MVTGPTITEGWNNLYCLERATEVQVREMSRGRQLRSVPPGFAKRVVAEMREGDPESMRLHLESIEQILTREDPAFATQASRRSFPPRREPMIVAGRLLRSGPL